MGLTETAVALGASAVLLIVAVVADRRPYRPGKLNYIPLMIICLAACLVLGRHLLTLIRRGCTAVEQPGQVSVQRQNRRSSRSFS